MSFLEGLPSTGSFTNYTTPSPLLYQNIPKYISFYSSSKEEPQVVKVDETNMIIRHLMKKKNQTNTPSSSSSSLPFSSSTTQDDKKDKGKRPAEPFPKEDEFKKAKVTSTPSSHTPTPTSTTASSTPKPHINVNALAGMSKIDLSNLCKARNLPNTGNKDQLIARLKQAASATKR
eukprot:TRINITY_DN1576_c0_g1_i1.p1 TRINITY_DN1576_c0_g1~~TRINITY_DN1576_c0_g1_i1.p1  ORF type:complete len:175 (+),score=46.81 TRINITY_DN1576_c0_g1_i1:93-617(+)